MKRLRSSHFLALAVGSARAENCGKSREYLLGNLGGDLTLPPKAYDDLFKICMATAAMANVKDAYILKDGGIARDRQAGQRRGDRGDTVAILRRLSESHPALPDAQGTAADQVDRERHQDIVDVIDLLSEDQGHL